MKKQLDLRGLNCPEPVLRTKKIIDDQTVSHVEALVDSEVNVQNLERLARSHNLYVKKEALGDHFRISINRQNESADESKNENATSSLGQGSGLGSGHGSGPGAAHSPNPSPSPDLPLSTSAGRVQSTVIRGGGTVVFIAKDTFGQGGDLEKDHDFSHNLLNVFLQTIFQSGLKPSAILLANSGVKLIDPDSATYKVLSDLKDGGTTVLACGLCLDYYGLKGKVAVKQVTNMFAICEYLFAADHVLSP
jgi:selenium metabolism protein YedF